LEKGIIPIHVSIEPEITKGRYHGYSTFLNQEVAAWLKAYLELRRRGTASLPPECITDESPLIRCRSPHEGQNNSIKERALGMLFSRLCHEAGIKRIRTATGFDVNVRSLRRFFRTQMSALGVQRDFVEYMMGHTPDTYLDLRMMGVEYFRRVYVISGISLKQKPEQDRLLLLKQAIERLDFKPEEMLKPEILDRLSSPAQIQK
jgi:hypothetical protein